MILYGFGAPTQCLGGGAIGQPGEPEADGVFGGEAISQGVSIAAIVIGEMQEALQCQMGIMGGGVIRSEQENGLQAERLLENGEIGLCGRPMESFAVSFG